MPMLNKNGILIIGDVPFVIALDSADVWANPNLFLMDAELNPTFVAGVPPDYFSRDGQLWGNPLYNWDVHRTAATNGGSTVWQLCCSLISFVWTISAVSQLLGMSPLGRPVCHCAQGRMGAWTR